MGRRPARVGAAALALVLALAAALAPGASAVVGGEPVAEDALPFVVRITDADGELVCTATVVAPRWVLTAGTCVSTAPPMSEPVDPAARRVTAGDAVHAVREVVRHPTFGHFYDVALLRISPPIDVEPVTLSATEEDEAPGTVLTLAGWGATDADGTMFEGLHTTEVTVVSDDVCATTFLIFGYAEETNICAGKPLGGLGVGDGGAPLLQQAGAAGWVQVGLGSWNLVTGAWPVWPDVYADVDAEAIRPWIDELVRPGRRNPARSV